MPPFDPRGRPPGELSGFSSVAVGEGAYTGGYDSGSDTPYDIVFVARGGDPQLITLTNGTDVDPDCHPYADFSNHSSIFATGSLGVVVADCKITFQYTIVGAAVSWQDLCEINVDTVGDIIGEYVNIPDAARCPVWLRMLAVTP